MSHYTSMKSCKITCISVALNFGVLPSRETRSCGRLKGATLPPTGVADGPGLWVCPSSLGLSSWIAQGQACCSHWQPCIYLWVFKNLHKVCIYTLWRILHIVGPVTPVSVHGCLSVVPVPCVPGGRGCLRAGWRYAEGRLLSVEEGVAHQPQWRRVLKG